MVFSSVTFLFYFLPVFLFAYFVLPFKNIVLLLASLLFYAWGEASYTIILLISILLLILPSFQQSQKFTLKIYRSNLSLGVKNLNPHGSKIVLKM